MNWAMINYDNIMETLIHEIIFTRVISTISLFFSVFMISYRLFKRCLYTKPSTYVCEIEETCDDEEVEDDENEISCNEDEFEIEEDIEEEISCNEEGEEIEDEMEVEEETCDDEIEEDAEEDQSEKEISDTLNDEDKSRELFFNDFEKITKDEEKEYIEKEFMKYMINKIQKELKVKIYDYDRKRIEKIIKKIRNKYIDDLKSKKLENDELHEINKKFINEVIDNVHDTIYSDFTHGKIYEWAPPKEKYVIEVFTDYDTKSIEKNHAPSINFNVKRHRSFSDSDKKKIEEFNIPDIKPKYLRDIDKILEKKLFV